jgi:hypothetical protein
VAGYLTSIETRLAALGATATIVLGLVAAGAFAARSPAPFSLSRLKPATPPHDWKLLVPPSGTSLLWYPPYMRQTSGDPWSVSAVKKGPLGTFLFYLNAGPKTGNPKMSTWPSFRLDHLREERNRSVHEDGQASGIPFSGGRGSCVLDDYLTRVAPNHYQEIACYVQGRTTASVIVAVALLSAWPKYGPDLERALEAFHVR